MHRRHAGESFLDIALHDPFKQVSGLFLNCMSDAKPSEIHIGSDVELVIRSPRGILQPGQTQDVWHVYARHSQVSAKVYMADAFVFNAANGELVESISMLCVDFCLLNMQAVRSRLVESGLLATWLPFLHCKKVNSSRCYYCDESLLIRFIS